MIPDSLLDDIITGFYDGVYSIYSLPMPLYTFTVQKLDTMFFSGFGKMHAGAIRETEKAINFRANIGRFSGAKTFQMSKDLTTLTSKVFLPDGTKRPFSDFKKVALEINKKYNVNWLKTEQDSVFMQSQNARKWIKFEEEADIFPLLRYVTVGDERVRGDHKALDGLTAPVGHSIWNRIMPQNGWGCRCTVIQLEGTARRSTNAQIRRKTRELEKEFKRDSAFDYNPGKKEYIFKETGKGKHDYFKVPRQFKDDLKNNFGFPDVQTVTGKNVIKWR